MTRLYLARESREPGPGDRFLTCAGRVRCVPITVFQSGADYSLGSGMGAVLCRLCDAELTETFVDIGMSPLCESYVPADRVDGPETFYPLHVRICSECLLVQLPPYVAGEDIFSDYLYFSSYSDSWVAHAKRYADEMIARLRLGPD